MQQTRARWERIAAARHIQVRETVPVGIEEQGSPIFVVLLGRPRLTLGGFDEAAVLPLDEQPAWDSCRTADEDIIQTVAVDVSHCQGRALSGERVREEGLYIVIDLRPGLVPVLQRPAGVDRLEWLMKQVGCSSLLNSVSLSQRHHSIDVQTREQLITPIGPRDFQAVHARDTTQPEMGPVIHRGHVASVRGVVEVLFLSAGRDDQCRSDPPQIGRLPLQGDPQIVMCVVLGLHVFVDECGTVGVVHDEIEFAVVIEIGVGRPVRKARLVHPPFFGSVGERQVTLVPEDVVGRLVPAQLPQDFPLSATRHAAFSRSARPEHGLLVIQIGDRLGIAVGDEDVLVSVIVEISKQGAPAPVGVRDPRQAGNVAEDEVARLRDSVVQLEGVDAIVDAKSLTP